jgi:hypothetical protein
VAIFVVWEVPGVFDVVFGFLPNNPMPALMFADMRGGMRNSFHYRTALDRWSVLAGMVFAYCTPKVERWLGNRGARAGVSVVLLGGLVGWWMRFQGISVREVKSYYAYINIPPVYAVVMLRCMTKTLRTKYSAFFAWIGKRSLEIFVLQFNVWMTGMNTRRVQILPDTLPLANFVVISGFFLLAAHLAHVATDKLRHFVAEDPQGIVAFLGAVGFSTAVAYLSNHTSLLVLILAHVLVAALFLLFLNCRHSMVLRICRGQMAALLAYGLWLSGTIALNWEFGRFSVQDEAVKDPFDSTLWAGAAVLVCCMTAVIVNDQFTETSETAY